ncbi:hypothetical protein P12x_001180 [Tundrisphaera lichenicola]|uniref:hypothetical protein n=1 Tax=Tundrisphaera lichenicola TaxID=2029860 RepID=UPI003EC09CB5
MGTTGRIGTGLLAICGLALAGLMAYTLTYDGLSNGKRPGPGPGHPVAADVAVFFPDRREWSHFQEAVELCSHRGLCRIAETSEGAIVVETPRQARRVRFQWHGTRGVRDTRDEVERIASRPRPPLAVVGSATTVLTAALAEALSREGPDGPVLLVPWATAVRAGGEGELLAIDPGRTFRFCPNNRRLAESVVDALLEQDADKLPGEVFLVIDPLDPYSGDLTDCFRRAIREKVPSARIIERTDIVGLPTPASGPRSVPTPSMADVALADAIWTKADASPDGRPTWVVLPLQGDPSRRMISALQSRASWTPVGPGEGPVRVVCGDAVGREALESLSGPRSFPIWCASISSIARPGLGVTDDTHAFAEIVSAIVLLIERSSVDSPTPDQLRDFLATLDLPETDPSAFGRPLRFDPEGERRDAPGSVLALRPGVPGLIGFALGKDGRWVRADLDREAFSGSQP